MEIKNINEKWFDNESVKIEDSNIDENNRPLTTIYNKLAKLADHDGTLTTINGDVKNYISGEDMIIRLAPKNFDVVSKELFSQLYKLI